MRFRGTTSLRKAAFSFIGRMAVISIIGVMIGVGIAVFAPAWAEARDRLGFDTLSAKEAWAHQNDYVWIDARSEVERQELPLSFAVPVTVVDEESVARILKRWDGFRALLVLCGSAACGRSREIAAELKASGFQDVIVLQGGMEALHSYLPEQ